MVKNAESVSGLVEKAAGLKFLERPWCGTRVQSISRCLMEKGKWQQTVLSGKHNISRQAGDLEVQLGAQGKSYSRGAESPSHYDSSHLSLSLPRSLLCTLVSAIHAVIHSLVTLSFTKVSYFCYFPLPYRSHFLIAHLSPFLSLPLTCSLPSLIGSLVLFACTNFPFFVFLLTAGPSYFHTFGLSRFSLSHVFPFLSFPFTMLWLNSFLLIFLFPFHCL